MTRKFVLRHWLTMRPLTGRSAILFGTCAIAIPTLLRMALDGYIGGAFVTPYVPFILISAIVLTWWGAGLVALASAMVGDALFVGRPYFLLEATQDYLIVGIFLLAAATIIGFVQLVRRMIADRPAADADEPSGIIFSVEDGQAWASRPGLGTRVRLGPTHEVADMMEDYLAQLELADRLKAAVKLEKTG